MITRSQFMILLEPKVSAIWNDGYGQWEPEWSKFCNVRETQKATVTDYKRAGFGSLFFKGEGAKITKDDPINGGTKTYQPVTFALAYDITPEMQRHELYGQVATFEQDLMRSSQEHQETIAVNILNGAFGTTGSDGYSATGFDGLQLCSTAHTRLDGGSTFRNRPSTDATLGVASLQAALIDYEGLKNDRGQPQRVVPKLLIAAPSDIFTVDELLSSEYKPGTANNEVNAIRKYGLDRLISHYMTDTNDWFLWGERHDVNFIWDLRPTTSTWTDEETKNVTRDVMQAYAVGFGEIRGTWGSHP